MRVSETKGRRGASYDMLMSGRTCLVIGSVHEIHRNGILYSKLRMLEGGSSAPYMIFHTLSCPKIDSNKPKGESRHGIRQDSPWRAKSIWYSSPPSPFASTWVPYVITPSIFFIQIREEYRTAYIRELVADVGPDRARATNA